MDISEQDGVTIIRVDGDDCSAIWKSIEAKARGGHLRLVIDLAGARFLNSVSIAAIIAVRNKLLQSNGSLAVANVPAPVQSVFRILKLERLFDLSLDTTAALARLRAG
jgi:anti-anti-sigma factor